MRLFINLAWFIKREWLAYLLGILSLLMVALLGLLPPAMVEKFANLLVERQLSSTAIFEIVGLIAVATIGQYIFRFGWSYFIWGTSARLEKTVRTQLFGHYLQMDAPFFQRYRTGDLLAHATNDISQLQRVAGNGVLQLFDAIMSGGVGHDCDGAGGQSLANALCGNAIVWHYRGGIRTWRSYPYCIYECAGRIFAPE